MSNTQTSLFTVHAIRSLEKDIIDAGIASGYTLMRRAGRAIFDLMSEKFSSDSAVIVICGAGNNAGDGYEFARIATQNGWDVRVVSLTDNTLLKGDAREAYIHWNENNKLAPSDLTQIEDADIIVDAILGTGISREVSEDWSIWIDAINAAIKPVISIDVPSGLNADTGIMMPVAVNADVTVTFIGRKRGMYTASGKECCGHIVLDTLIPDDSIIHQKYTDTILTNAESAVLLTARRHESHKGQNGHVLIIGGNTGMPGAVILAAKAALRTGAGLVSIVTKPEHVSAAAAACPEAMVHGSVNGEIAEDLVQKATAIIIGPGLGRDAWATRLFAESCVAERPMIIDADALNIFKDFSHKIPNNIITPHPGEAAKLLSLDTSAIQQDRFAASKRLHEETGSVVVLKGSGTIVYSGHDYHVCSDGNPAMAVAGMGDALSGAIAACVAQGLSVSDAAIAGVYYHALAGDLVAGDKTIGLMASDLIEKLPEVVNRLARYYSEHDH